MIITRLTGGLGNQMFQYAAGLALAERHRTVCKLDLDWYNDPAPRRPHERYGLGCFNISEALATVTEVERTRGFALTRTERWATTAIRHLRLNRWSRSLQSRPGLRYEGGHRYNPAFAEWPADTYLHGMWQSEKYFASVAPLVRAQFSFRYPLSARAAEWASRIRATPDAVAVHIRRGDYLNNPVYHREIGPLDRDYYQAAVHQVKQRFPHAVLFLFSDDIASVAAEFKADLPVVFVGHEAALEDWDTLHLMTLCQHAIIANSTFSWWGAYLQTPGRDHLVIAPTPWFADGSRDGTDIVPSRWLQLSRVP